MSGLKSLAESMFRWRHREHDLQKRTGAQKAFAETPIGRSLAWLADAPLFIDGTQVAALYNAVVKPEYKEATVKVSLKNLKSLELTGEGGAEAQIGAASWLKTIFPFPRCQRKSIWKSECRGWT
jgi:hypothetical protein